MKVHQKRVHGKDDPTGPTHVKVQLSMPKEEAVKLFHAVNRMLTLIDEGAALNSSDNEDYDRANEFLAQLQRELGIELEDADD